MIDKLRDDARRAWAWTLGMIDFRGSRWMRRTCTAVVVVVVLFGLAGFVGVPLLAQHVVAGRLAASLHRPVSLGQVRFNPYTLRLNVRRLHIGARDPSERFVDIGHIQVKVSWISLFRLAPVVGAVEIDHPAIRIVRTAEQRFNFSDLLETSGPTPAPTPTPSKPAKPQRFAVYNIQIHEGEVHFDDKVLNARHTVEHLDLDVPFIANLPADVDIFVQPLLQMVVDGSRMRIAGKTKPFAVPPESVVNLNLHRLSLPLYMGYVPKKLPLKIPRGALSSLLQVHFVNAAGAPEIRVSGEFALDDVDVRDAANAPLAGFKHLSVDLTELKPLKGVTHLGKVYLDGLTVHVVRNPDGTINLASLTKTKPARAAAQAAPGPAAASLAAAQPSAAKTPAAAPTTTAATTPAATPAPAANTAQLIANAPPAAARTSQPAGPAARPSAPANVSLEELVLTNGAVEITDNSVAPPAKLALRNLQVGLKDLRTVGQTAPAPFNLSTTLGGGGSIAVKGALDLAHSQATTDITLDAIDLPALQGFVEPVLAAAVASGKLSAHANVHTLFAAGRFNVHVSPASISLDKFELHAAHESENPIGWNKLSASIGQVDLATRQATVTEVRADGLHLFVRRERNGQLNLAALMRGAAAPQARPTPRPRRARASSRRHEKATVEKKPAGKKASAGRERRVASTARRRRSGKPAARAPAPTPSSGGWRYQVASVAIEKTEIRVEDDTMPRTVAIAVAPLNFHLKNVSNDLSRPIAIDLDGILDRKGSFKVTGTAAPEPLKLNLRVVTRRLDLAPFDPYVTGHLNTTIARAALSINGEVGVSKERREMRVSYRGDAALGSVRMLDKVTHDSFLRWNSFRANGIDFKLGSGPPKFHVAALDLSNFYARIILNSDGRLNLRDVMASPEKAPTSLTRAHGAPGSVGAAPTPAPSASPAPSPAAASNEAGATAPAAAASPAAAPSPAPLPADLAVGRVSLHGGQVNYSDNFIKPNYSADLTEISGKVGSFGTGSTTPADLELDGQVNGNAPLTISGSINPLTPLAFVDIKAKAEGVELTNLSTYSTKYTGYPITKGTLTVDLHYLLEQQKLTAENHIFIDQLTFGDKVASPNAINLPIRLAVALLKNSQGQIDLHLPVSGSLSDPQFSVGGIVLHAIVGLIMRAATSPFSLIASAVGGLGGASGEDLNYVVFSPGWASLTAAARSKLDTVVKALQVRPALKLDICGRVDPKLDREGLPEALVAQSVARQKLLDAGQNAAGVDLASVQITPDEYNRYLKRAYKAAKFDKPKDFLGLTKSLPPDEMKKLMIAHTKVTDADLKKLAEARANAVRKALIAAKIDPARLIVVAPKLNADGIKDSGKTTRAELSLE
ncbi:MAG TPA: DUF748 domain-containing protein [Candidatus Binataceae bacterium]|nr:DUF748 domain-containing protein [Candidatus Binataceae bacterium]